MKFEHASTGSLRGMKGDMWEGGSRIPFIVSAPLLFPEGRASDQMICYRAETAIANLLATHYRKTSADLYPDYQTNNLMVRLNSLAIPRYNMTISEICQTLYDFEAVFPGTKLKLFFKTATLQPARDHEF